MKYTIIKISDNFTEVPIILKTMRFFIPVRRARVGLPLHAFLGEEINALEVLIHFVGPQHKTQGRVFGNII